MQYLFPFNMVPPESKIILYGAGKVGKNFYIQLKSFENNQGKAYSLQAWVDKSFDVYESLNKPFDYVRNITNYDFDYIIIAIVKRDIANSIKNDLIKMNIPEDKLIWSDSYRFIGHEVIPQNIDLMVKNFDFYNEILIEYINDKSGFGESKFYQSFKEIGIIGQRDTEERINFYEVKSFLTNDDIALDIGCNCGFFSIQIAKYVKKIVGYEISPSLVNIAKKVSTFLNINNVEFRCENFVKNRRNEKYNVIFAFAVHVWLISDKFNENDFVDMIYNLLEDKGYLFFESNNTKTYDSSFQKLCSMFTSKGMKICLNKRHVDTNRADIVRDIVVLQKIDNVDKKITKSMDQKNIHWKNTDLQRFTNLTENRDIICFGAGQELINFFHYCPLSNKIKYVIDNNPSKWNTTIEVKGQEKTILPPDQIPYLVNENSIILVTISANSSGVEIFHQLNEMVLPIKQDVFWSSFIMDQIQSWTFMSNQSLPQSFRLTKEAVIPKIIHYCWVGNNPIPKEHQKYIDDWKRLCPDYEFILWNEKNYDIEKNQYMKEAYEAKKWGFVSDYIRKDVIYEYGGIYLDTDVEMIKRPDDLLYQNGFCGIGKRGRVNVGSGYGARKKLPIIKELRDVYNDEIFQFKEKGMKIGPHFETEIFEKHGFKRNGKFQIVADMTIYPLEVLSILKSDGEPFITENTYTVHHFANSWVSSEWRESKIKARNIYNLLESV